MSSMKQRRTASSRYILDPVLCLSVLVVSVRTTKGQSLFRENDGIFKCLGVKKAIVRVVMLDLDPVSFRHAFER